MPSFATPIGYIVLTSTRVFHQNNEVAAYPALKWQLVLDCGCKLPAGGGGNLGRELGPPPTGSLPPQPPRAAEEIWADKNLLDNLFEKSFPTCVMVCPRGPLIPT